MVSLFLNKNAADAKRKLPGKHSRPAGSCGPSSLRALSPVLSIVCMCRPELVADDSTSYQQTAGDTEGYVQTYAVSTASGAAVLPRMMI